MYGGMCLGPVNTAAVHAMAYPLGSRFKIAHGISNAMLLPHVMTYNRNSAIERYAGIGRALGAEQHLPDEAAALKGIEIIDEMIRYFGLPRKLAEVKIPGSEIENFVRSAMKIQRLLKNNVREINPENAIEIYRRLL